MRRDIVGPGQRQPLHDRAARADLRDGRYGIRSLRVVHERPAAGLRGQCTGVERRPEVVGQARQACRGVRPEADDAQVGAGERAAVVQLDVDRRIAGDDLLVLDVEIERGPVERDETRERRWYVAADLDVRARRHRQRARLRRTEVGPARRAGRLSALRRRLCARRCRGPRCQHEERGAPGRSRDRARGRRAGPR